MTDTTTRILKAVVLEDPARWYRVRMASHNAYVDELEKQLQKRIKQAKSDLDEELQLAYETLVENGVIADGDPAPWDVEEEESSDKGAGRSD